MKRLYLFFLIALLSCSSKNPSWIKGEWIDKKADYNIGVAPQTIWKFDDNNIYVKTTNDSGYYKFSSTIMISFEKIEQEGRLILKRENASDTRTKIEVFAKINSDSIKYYDSSYGSNQPIVLYRIKK